MAAAVWRVITQHRERHRARRMEQAKGYGKTDAERGLGSDRSPSRTISRHSAGCLPYQEEVRRFYNRHNVQLAVAALSAPTLLPSALLTRCHCTATAADSSLIALARR